MSALHIRRWPFVVLCLLVFAVATGLSWYLGELATLLYGTICTSRPNIELGGRVLGIVGGALGSAGWCVLMVSLALRYVRRTGRASAKLILWGTFAGHGAALLAAAMLHGGLMLIDGEWTPEAASTGLIFAAGAGLGLGVISGLLAWGAAALAIPRELRPDLR